MTRYLIQNTTSAAVLGVYEAASKAEALEMDARNAGYESRADMIESLRDPDEPYDDSDILVTELSGDNAGLDVLLDEMRANDESLGDWTELPTFGGTEPLSTLGVWSWDENRMIVGTCSDDVRIIYRWDQ